MQPRTWIFSSPHYGLGVLTWEQNLFPARRSHSPVSISIPISISTPNLTILRTTRSEDTNAINYTNIPSDNIRCEIKTRLLVHCPRSSAQVDWYIYSTAVVVAQRTRLGRKVVFRFQLGPDSDPPTATSPEHTSSAIASTKRGIAVDIYTPDGQKAETKRKEFRESEKGHSSA